MTLGASPDFGSALVRARSLYDAGRHSDAESAILEVLGSGAATTEVFRLIALIQRALNDPVREARALEQALARVSSELAPEETVRLWARLGAIRAWLGDLANALAAYERAIRIAPADLESLQGIARAQFATHDLEGARRSAHDLEQRFPQTAFTHLISGHVHKAFGEAPAAIDSYTRALDCDPCFGEALYNLVDLAVPAMNSAIAKRAAQLASREDLLAADRINVNFAQARIFDAAGRYSEAFEAFRRANDLARRDLAARGVEYVPGRVEKRVTRTIAEYNQASFGSSLDPLPIEFQPIFIIGLPRSGTTLIEQILASHGDVQTAGEIVFARECEHSFRQGREAAGRIGPVDPSDSVDSRLLETAREQYLERIFERGLDGAWIVDKLPANFEIAGFLRVIFPQSPIIHSVRDPRATCFSLYCANFGSHEPWYHDLKDLAHFHGQYRRLMGHWKKIIPAPFEDVVYEQLVNDPQTQIPLLLEALGLAFDPSCLEFYRHQRPVLTASHSQVRRPVYTGAIDHWRNYAEWLGPLRGLSDH